MLLMPLTLVCGHCVYTCAGVVCVCVCVCGRVRQSGMKAGDVDMQSSVLSVLGILLQSCMKLGRKQEHRKAWQVF